jgi:hypothetical protein
VLVSPDGASERFSAAFVATIASHRFWERAGRNRLSASGVDRETRGCTAPRPGRADGSADADSPRA